MLVLLTGVPSVAKKDLGRTIWAHINNEQLKALAQSDGYTADFTSNTLSAFDSTGTLVYTPGDDTTEGVDTLLNSNPQLLHEFEGAYDKHLIENNINHLYSIFCSLDHELGLTDIPSYMRDLSSLNEGLLAYPHQFDDIVNNIKNSYFMHNVITGTFSSHFIDNIKMALPDEDIIIINIVRNPTVSYLMHSYDQVGITDEEALINNRRFFEATINAYEISKRPDTKTIRFENISKGGSIPVGAAIIKLGKSYSAGITPWITSYEDTVATDVTVDLDVFNNLITSFKLEDIDNYQEDILDRLGLSLDDVNSLTSGNFPKNIFAESGYNSLSIPEILG